MKKMERKETNQNERKQKAKLLRQERYEQYQKAHEKYLQEQEQADAQGVPSKYDVSHKILRGARLTPYEFEIALKEGYIGKCTFEQWDSIYYEDDKRIGYLRLMNNMKIADDSQTQADGTRSCFHDCWGLTKENIKKEYLRPEQEKYW